MSFILDALKKSETDRQERSSAEFAGVPTSSAQAAVPRWLWALGVLLLINLVVLLGLLLRSMAGPESISVTPVADSRPAARFERVQKEPTSASPNATDSSFEEKIAAAKQRSPLPRDATAGSAAAATPLTEPVSAPDLVATSPEPLALPTIYEVIADGSVVLPELHLDIHVYSDVPKDRFVFINMAKQREQSQLAEGPVVKEITPQGVVLEHRGIAFLLPRD